VPQPPDDKPDSRPRLTETQRQQKERTNQYGLDQYRTEGNVIAVERGEDGLVVTLALGRGETIDVVFACKHDCPNVRVGDYVEADGEVHDDGRFQADDIHIAH
jgi:hypothetical protein